MDSMRDTQPMPGTERLVNKSMRIQDPHRSIENFDYDELSEGDTSGIETDDLVGQIH
jgi:hypothetical protein